MSEKLTTYDPTEDLQSEEAMASFMGEAFSTNDPKYIVHALSVVAHALGIQRALSRPTAGETLRSFPFA